MPQAIPFIAAVAASAAEASALATAFIVASAQVVSANIQRRDAARAARRAFNEAQRDRQITLRSAVSPRTLVLGRVRVGGTLVYADSVGPKKQYLDQVIACAWHECDAIEGIYVGDQYLPLSGFTGDAPTSGKYSYSRIKRGVLTFNLAASNTFTIPSDKPLDTTPDMVVNVITGSGDSAVSTQATVSSVVGQVVTLSASYTGTAQATFDYQDGGASLRLQTALGTDGQTTTNWSGITTPKWTSNHRLRGVAYIRPLMVWNENAWETGALPFSAVVRGVNKAYDPRKNTVPNVFYDGAAVGGSPGTSKAIAGLPGGVTATVAGIGFEDGMPYLDVRWQGTAAAAGSALIYTFGSSANGTAASSGQTWHASQHARLVGGTLPTNADVRIIERDAGGVAVASSLTAYTPTQMAATSILANRLTHSRTLTNAGTTKVQCDLRVSIANGATVDFTIRHGLASLSLGSDAFGYTANSALLAGWYMTHPRVRGGCGMRWTMVNWTALGDAASVCDELITVRKKDGSGYEQIKRYECNIELTTAQAPLRNLDAILATMDGSRAFTAGKYCIFAGAFRTAALTLTDADVAAGRRITIVPTMGRAAPPNIATATFYDELRNWVPSVARPVVNSTYVAADGGDEESIDLDLAGVSDERRANYLMGVALERARSGFEMSVTVKGVGANIALGDTLQTDLTHYEAFDGKTWEVVQYTNRWNGEYDLRLREMRSNSWTLDADRFTAVDAPPAPDLSYLWTVEKPTGLAAESGTNVLTRLPDGTISSGVRLTWTLHPNTYVQQSGRIEVRSLDPRSGKYVYWPAVDGDETETTLRPMLDGKLYNFEIRAVNGLGTPSRWATVRHMIVGKTQPPSDVAGLAAAQIPGAIRITWNLPTDADYETTELRQFSTATWASGLRLDTGVAGSTPAKGGGYDWAWPAAGSYVIMARHRDRSGNLSVSTATVSITVTAAGIAITETELLGPVGGGNLVRNSSFEVDTDGNGVPDYWTGTSFGSGVTVVRDLIGPAVHGAKGFRLNITALSSPSTDLHAALHDIDVSPTVVEGRSYRISTDALTGNTAYKARFGVVWLDSSDATISSSAFDITLASTLTWKRLVAGVVTAPAGAVKARPFVGIRRPSVSDTTLAAMVFDRFQLEEGDIATGWKPADVDTNAILPGAATTVSKLAASSFSKTITVTVNRRAQYLKVLTWVNNTGRTVEVEVTGTISVKGSASGGKVFMTVGTNPPASTPAENDANDITNTGYDNIETSVSTGGYTKFVDAESVTVDAGATVFVGMRGAANVTNTFDVLSILLRLTAVKG